MDPNVLELEAKLDAMRVLLARTDELGLTPVWQRLGSEVTCYLVAKDQAYGSCKEEEDGISDLHRSLSIAIANHEISNLTKGL